MSYLRTGLAGDQPGCRIWEFGAFKPQCWCLDHPALCSPDQYKAAIAWAYPGDVYVPMPKPPVPAAPTGAALTVPPASGEQAQATVDEILAAQMREWQARNAQAMQETEANIEAIDTSDAGISNLLPKLELPTWAWVALAGFSGLVLVSASGGRR